MRCICIGKPNVSGLNGMRYLVSGHYSFKAPLTNLFGIWGNGCILKVQTSVDWIGRIMTLRLLVPSNIIVIDVPMKAKECVTLIIDTLHTFMVFVSRKAPSQRPMLY